MPRRETRSSRVIRFIETYCRTPEGAHVGQPLRLEPFQKRFIKEVYDSKVGTRKAILSMARKNGKSAIVASLLLCHLVGPEAKRNSQIVSGAMSRDQAALVFNLACKMIRFDERLTKVIRIVPSGKRLVGLPLNVEYHALAADGTTAQGLSPILAIIDEAGQVRGPKSEFIEAITTSQGAHAEPLLITISTQAPNASDLLSLWIDDARTGADPHTVCHVYEAPEDCELDDERAWKAANPALGKFRDRADVERQAAAAKRMPSFEPGFRNLTLNQRVEAVAPFVSRSVWKACEGVTEPPLGPVYAGIDLSAVADLTAIEFVWRSGDRWDTESHFWTPGSTLHDRARRDRAPYDVWAKSGALHTTPGATLDYDWIAKFLLEQSQRFQIEKIAFDRWRIDQFKAALQRQGADLEFMERLEPFGQGFVSMGPALDALETALLNGRLRHDGNPVLTMCAANAVIVKDPAGNRKLDKMKSTGRIDGMVALAMAVGIAHEALEEQAVEVFAETW